MLSIVALDSHYSHHPISIDLSSAVLGLGDLVPVTAGQSGFDQLLRGAAGWLADELYLHPTTVAVQRDYELKFGRRFPGRFRDASSKGELPQLLNDLMTQGLGPPNPHRLAHLVRLSFPLTRPQLLGSSTHYETMKQLTRELVAPPNSYVSIDFNEYTGRLHVDILVHRGTTIGHIAYVFTRLQRWLLRVLEADSLARIRRLYPGRRKEVAKKAKARDMQRQLDRYVELFQAILDSALAALLPDHHRIVFSEFMPGRENVVPVLIRAALSDGEQIDTATARLKLILSENPDAYPPERLQDVRCLLHALDECVEPLVLVCHEKVVVRNQAGQPVDEWDGVLASFSEKKATLIIVEAKTGGTAQQREESAFKQLGETRKLLRERYVLHSRRKRIARMGAMIKFEIDRA